MNNELLSKRLSGILLHPTSLPGPYGIGDLGSQAYKFIDILAKSKQSLWSILPLGPTFKEDFHCPYSSYSGFAGNIFLISPEKLYKEGLISRADLNIYTKSVASKNKSRINYTKLEPAKAKLLRLAYQNSIKKDGDLIEGFLHKHPWARDFASFTALRKKINKTRKSWDVDLRTKNPKRIKNLLSQLSEEVRFEIFCQHLFFKQWAELRSYAHSKNVYICGDLPIYMADDSADVWAHPEYFQLDRKTGLAKLVSGVPPDSFSKTGQLWNHPIYNWSEMEKDHFGWWVDRMKTLFGLVDYLRIDHFRGFVAYWGVQGNSKTAEHGMWMTCPGEKLFHTLQKKLGDLPIVVEDLGVITPDVEDLRDRFGFMGMKILQMGFDSSGPLSESPYVPINFLPNYVVYTGTHDNNTSLGWYESLPQRHKRRLMQYLGIEGKKELIWSFIRLAQSSVARWSIIPVQDIMHLGREARINHPGTADWKNWTWRMADNISSPKLEKLRELTETYQRAF